MRRCRDVFTKMTWTAAVLTESACENTSQVLLHVRTEKETFENWLGKGALA